MGNMRKRIYFTVIFLAFMTVSSLGAQIIKSMSLNGSTGLYSIPSAHIGWDDNSLGLDFGYQTIIPSSKVSNIPAAAVSLLKIWELSIAIDVQPEDRGTDVLLGTKVQLPVPNTSFALGGNLQLFNRDNNKKSHKEDWALQIYVANTFSGSFFSWPAETTLVLGKTFYEENNDWSIDFGMGFDLVFMPQLFKNFTHLIVDFANFSYSSYAYGADAWVRGVMNAGIRINLSQLEMFRKYKFALDILGTDLFDANRAFSMGLVFGVPLYNGGIE